MINFKWSFIVSVSLNYDLLIKLYKHLSGERRVTLTTIETCKKAQVLSEEVTKLMSCGNLFAHAEACTGFGKSLENPGNPKRKS